MRYRVLLSAFMMQMCLGATYSWSVYVQPIKSLTGLLQGPAQIPFTVFYFVFPAIMMVSGKILDRLGPRTCAILGGVIFGSGWVAASLGQRHFVLTVTGVGIMGGIGVGLVAPAYQSLISKVVPAHLRGTAFGLFSTSLGLVSLPAPYIGGLLWKGVSPQFPFAITAVVSLIAIIPVWLKFKLPKEEQPKTVGQ